MPFACLQVKNPTPILQQQREVHSFLAETTRISH